MVEVFACPCCGYKTITDTFNICRICTWQHDPVQERNPDSRIGANAVPLREAQSNFQRYGVNNPEEAPLAMRPTETDERDPNWKPLDEG